VTQYVSGTGLAGAGNLDVIELRVISNLIQQYNGGQASQEDLRFLRNDQAFELGFPPPAVVPGQ
jgi:hypothetical protein